MTFITLSSGYDTFCMNNRSFSGDDQVGGVGDFSNHPLLWIRRESGEIELCLLGHVFVIEDCERGWWEFYAAALVLTTCRL